MPRLLRRARQRWRPLARATRCALYSRAPWQRQLSRGRSLTQKPNIAARSYDYQRRDYYFSREPERYSAEMETTPSAYGLRAWLAEILNPGGDNEA